MHRYILSSVIILLMLCANSADYLQCSSKEKLTNLVHEFLRNRIEIAGFPPKLMVGEEPILASVMLPRFYERRSYRPAWISDNGPTFQVKSLINEIKEAEREGLRSEDYHLVKIESIMRETRRNQEKKTPFNPRILVDLELLLTDSFLIYGSHLLTGKVNPESIDAEWFANRREADMVQIIEVALNSNQVAESLKNLLPAQTGYKRLKSTLAQCSEILIKGGWNTIPEGPKIQKGDRGIRVFALRTRLVASKDLNFFEKSDEDVFDDRLEEAVRRFQRRHGLDIDGIVGALTLAAMNVPVEERVRQIELNMERWRWLPQDLGSKHILINIANFELDINENNKQVMTMRVVVGKQYRRTPVFSAKMTYLVLSPYWHIPPRLAIQDKLPLIRKDVSYLEKQKIRIFQGWGAETKEVDPTSIDWSQITAKNFNFRLRQDPGPLNALGGVKFMFPNRFNVYLHDTPSRELFGKTVRAFSSGCIRIENPIEQAVYLLQENSRWTKESILAAIDRGVEQTLLLKDPVPVHLLYWTTWAEEDGLIHFRDDIYGRDKRLDEALKENPPASLKENKEKIL